MKTEFRFETISLAEMGRKGLVAETSDYRPVVLIVDDEPIIADTRAAILNAWGYATMTAYDAESALQFAEVIPPELLITDVQMTGMNGVDLAIAIKMSAPDCKVILFSGHAGSNEIITSARNSGYDFPLLAKPLQPAQLLAYLSKIDFGPRSNPKARIESAGKQSLSLSKIGVAAVE